MTERWRCQHCNKFVPDGTAVCGNCVVDQRSKTGLLEHAPYHTLAGLWNEGGETLQMGEQ